MKVSSCNLDEIILVEKEVTFRKADGGLETNDYCIQKVTTRIDLQNIVKCPGDSQRYCGVWKKKKKELSIFELLGG